LLVFVVVWVLVLLLGVVAECKTGRQTDSGKFVDVNVVDVGVGSDRQ
jgi:hypothetical protein